MHTSTSTSNPECSGRRLFLDVYYKPPFLVTALFLLWVWARYIQIGVRGGGVLGSMRFEFVLGGILVLLSLFVLMASPLNIKRSNNVIMGISLLFFAMVVQIPFAAMPQIAQDVFVDRVIKFSFLTIFICALIRSPDALRWFIIVWMISIFWVTLESVRGLVSGALIWQNQGVMRLHGSVPIYAHPNSLGGVAMGAIPFVVFLWSVWRRWWQRFGLLALLTTSMICIIYSGSRTSYVALISFIVFWFFRSSNKRRFVIIVLIIAPVTILSIPDEYIERFQSITGEEAEGNSKEARREILEDAWAVFIENPAGVGLGCFPVVRDQMFGRKQDTHNLYFEVATNIGIQGLIIFIFFIWAVMAALFRAFKDFNNQSQKLAYIFHRSKKSGSPIVPFKKHQADLAFLKAVANASAGFVFIRLVLGFFGMDLYEVYWWFGAGLAICLLEMVENSSKRTNMAVLLQSS